MNPIFTKVCFSLIVLFVISCKEGPNNNSESPNSNSGEAMVLQVDGETYTYGVDDLSGDCFWDSTAEIVRAKFRTKFDRSNIRQLTLNFNLWGTDLITGVPGTFEVSEFSEKGIRRADVNIVDFNRATDQTLALLSGSITVHQWTGDHIHFSFEGQAGGILNPQTTIPVSGTVNMNCSKR